MLRDSSCRDQVFLALKGREHDGLDRRFDVMISVLRRKLGDDAKEPRRIKTVWGKGYLFVADSWEPGMQAGTAASC